MENDCSPCEDCGTSDALLELELRVEKVLDLCQAVELLDPGWERNRTIKDFGRAVAKLLKEPK
jgi:hypothetical protein